MGFVDDGKDSQMLVLYLVCGLSALVILIAAGVLLGGFHHVDLAVLT